MKWSLRRISPAWCSLGHSVPRTLLSYWDLCTECTHLCSLEIGRGQTVSHFVVTCRRRTRDKRRHFSLLRQSTMHGTSFSFLLHFSLLQNLCVVVLLNTFFLPRCSEWLLLTSPSIYGSPDWCPVQDGGSHCPLYPRGGCSHDTPGRSYRQRLPS